jgi:membrane protease YdiL (CAAX protease family)
MGRTRKVRKTGVLTRIGQCSPRVGAASSAVRAAQGAQPQAADSWAEFNMDSSSNEHESDGFRTAVLVEGGVALLAMFLVWLFGVPVRAMLPADSRALAWQTAVGVVATLPMLAMFFWLVRAKHPALQQLREQVDWLVRELFPAASLPQFMLIALLAGVGEELLFRGVVQSVLANWTSPIAGLILASVLFGLVHAMSRVYFVLATLIGVYLGALMIGFNSLAAPMVAHSLYDFFALAYLSRKQSHVASDEP